MLLEPFYAFHLTIPDKMVGRAMTDLECRFAVFEGSVLEDGQAILTGRAPVSSLDGYGPCHNEEEVIEAAGYDPDADLANPSGSVFCSHGAGFVVNWDKVKDCVLRIRSGNTQTDQEADIRIICWMEYRKNC